MHPHLRAPALAAAALALLGGFETPRPRAAGPLRHEAYVWQRAWTDAVAESVRTQAPEWSRLVALGAEIAWGDGGPEVARTDARLDDARADERPGVALRIGAWSGPFDESGDATQCVLATAADLLADARAAGVEPSELHVDFDCATSRLDGFRRWIVALRAAAAPTPVTFTALPAWLRSDAFPRLARAADGYVLQVHSLERPAAPDEIGVLCDPVRARRWVERAARIGVPFRVALPTYGYDAAFDAGGRFLGLEAETAARAWPAGTRRVGVAADPAAMASLVRAWTEDRPRELAGLIWYRLPAPDDRRNWTADALRRVRRGEVPTADVRVTVERPEPGLAQIRVENRGPLPGRSPAAFSVRWSGARLVASDGLGGFALGADGPGRVAARREEGATVAADSSRVVAWLRFDGAAEEVAVDASR